MTTATTFEQDLMWVCQHNAQCPKQDRIMVNMDTGQVYPAVYHAPVLSGRNDPCPCGSGLKFKKCCINKGENK